jgi:hypothetical protein
LLRYRLPIQVKQLPLYIAYLCDYLRRVLILSPWG